QQGGLNKLKGIWKLIKTGNEGLATNIDEYLSIAEYGKGEIFYLRKANSGLYEHGQSKEFAWSVWSTSNKISNDIYFNLDKTRSKGDLIEFTSNSKRQLIWKGKQYEYFGEDISYY